MVKEKDKRPYKKSTEIINNSDIVKYKEPQTGLECYRLWLDRIEEAITHRMHLENGDNDWIKYYKYYDGNYWDWEDGYSDNSEFTSDRVTINITASVVNDTLAFLLNTDPEFTAKPRKLDSVLSSKIQAELLNVEWEAYQMQEQLEWAVTDAVVIGNGIIKTGYEFEVDNNPKRMKEGYINYDDFVKKENPYIYRVNPFQFVFDYDARDKTLNTARWCCEVIFKPIQDILNNDSYDQSVIKMIRDGRYAIDTVQMFKSHINQNDRTQLWDHKLYSCDVSVGVMYEVWDKKFRKYYLFAAGVEFPLVEKLWPYDYLLDDCEGFPYEMYQYQRRPDECYGYGIPALMEDCQHEINRFATTLRYRREISAAKKVGYRAGSLSPEQVKKANSAVDGEWVEINGDPKSDISVISEGSLNPDQYNIFQIFNTWIEELTGSSKLSRGGNLKSRTSASEVSSLNQYQGIKIDSKVKGIERFVCNIGYKILSHIRNNMTGDQAIELLGALGTYWQEFTGDELSSRFILRLKSMSASQEKQEKLQKRIQIFQMLLGAIQVIVQGGVQVDIGALVKYVLDAFDDPEIARFFPQSTIISGNIQSQAEPKGQVPLQQGQQPNPQQQQIQQNAVQQNSLNQGFQGQFNQGGY